MNDERNDMKLGILKFNFQFRLTQSRARRAIGVVRVSMFGEKEFTQVRRVPAVRKEVVLP